MDGLNAATLIDIFLLLLIGVGPKIALVPYLEVTGSMSAGEKAQVARKMLRTAATVAVTLLVFGGILTRLLHFSHAALSIAGGIILLIIAVSMVLSPPGGNDRNKLGDKDPMTLAVFPLAVPYLLNPAGVVALVVLSAEASSVVMFAAVVALLLAVLALDVVVFRVANRVGKHLDESRMLVTEKVFGFLLAALAVQLVIDGIVQVGDLIH